jgi:hypothetical protein
MQRAMLKGAQHDTSYELLVQEWLLADRIRALSSVKLTREEGRQ